MLVIKCGTPRETMESVIEYLKETAIRHKSTAKGQKLRKDQIADIARANACLNVALMFSDCNVMQQETVAPTSAQLLPTSESFWCGLRIEDTCS